MDRIVFPNVFFLSRFVSQRSKSAVRADGFPKSKHCLSLLGTHGHQAGQDELWGSSELEPEAKDRTCPCRGFKVFT